MPSSERGIAPNPEVVMLSIRVVSLILLLLAFTGCGDPSGPTVNQNINGGGTGIVAIGGTGDDADANDAAVTTPAPVVVPPVVTTAPAP